MPLSRHQLIPSGGYRIISPEGKDFARAGAQEQLIVAKIDRQSVITARHALDYLKGAAKLKNLL